MPPPCPHPPHKLRAAQVGALGLVFCMECHTPLTAPEVIAQMRGMQRALDLAVLAVRVTGAVVGPLPQPRPSDALPSRR